MQNSEVLKLVGRDDELFDNDLMAFELEISEAVRQSSFLVVGAAGSIGRAVTREIFNRSPLKLHAVDLSENSLVELVRDLRSSKGYIAGEFKTFCLDANSPEFDAFWDSEGPMIMF